MGEALKLAQTTFDAAEKEYLEAKKVVEKKQERINDLVVSSTAANSKAAADLETAQKALEVASKNEDKKEIAQLEKVIASANALAEKANGQSKEAKTLSSELEKKEPDLAVLKATAEVALVALEAAKKVGKATDAVQAIFKQNADCEELYVFNDGNIFISKIYAKIYKTDTNTDYQVVARPTVA